MSGKASTAVELTAATALQWLQGVWRFAREVPGQAKMVGSAEIAIGDAGIATFRERATVSLPGGERLAGSRAYRLEPLSSGFRMFFVESGTLFAELRFQEREGVLVTSAEHLCLADRYRSTWRLGPDRSFTVQHEVSGPRKQYVSESLYRPEMAVRVGS